MRFGETGGAVGWLVGEPNRGLACMFTMMNKARLFTGLQGVAIAERATQKAVAFALERRQGRAAGSPGTSAIIAHPDVRRMLARMRALTAAARAIAHRAARAIDEDHRGERAGLLTPITKAYCSEVGCEVTSLGVQVHGGMGYVEETGAAQFFRDARITRRSTRGRTASRRSISRCARSCDRAAASPKPSSRSSRPRARPPRPRAGRCRRSDHRRGPRPVGSDPLAARTVQRCREDPRRGVTLSEAFRYGSRQRVSGGWRSPRQETHRRGDRSPVLEAAISDATTFAQTEAVLAPASVSIVVDNRVPKTELIA